MNTDPSSSVQQARRELGARLRQLRKAAGLTGKQLAAATGQHFTRISRIENGGQAATERNIRDWCTLCNAADQIPDLLATAQSIESAYLEWTRQSRAGMRRLGDLHSIATYQHTSTFRIHEPVVMPGIFQTDTYIRQMLTFWYQFLGAPDDGGCSLRRDDPVWSALADYFEVGFGRFGADREARGGDVRVQDDGEFPDVFVR